jgi:hypothetical protein
MNNYYINPTITTQTQLVSINNKHYSDLNYNKPKDETEFKVK